MHPFRAPTTRLLLLALLSLTVALAGCEKNESEAEADETASNDESDSSESEDAPPDSEGEEPSDPDEDSGEESAAGGSAPRVVVIEQGAEPRTELRYSLKEGAVERVALVMSISMQTRAPGLPSTPITMPGIRMVMDVAVEEKLSGDEARYGFEVTDAGLTDTEGVNPMVVERTEPELKKAIGMSGTATVDTRGFNRDVEIELPAGISPQMRQMMQGTKQSLDQLSSPLPEEPVGVGARWEVHQNIELNGLKVKQKTVYELKKLDGNTGVLEANITQTAPKQEANTPGLPPGVTAELLSFDSTGSGEVHFNLDKLVPETAKIDMETSNSFKIKAQGREQSMNMKASMGMKIEHL